MQKRSLRRSLFERSLPLLQQWLQATAVRAASFPAAPPSISRQVDLWRQHLFCIGFHACTMDSPPCLSPVGGRHCFRPALTPLPLWPAGGAFGREGQVSGSCTNQLRIAAGVPGLVCCQTSTAGST
jgi:hypothetical protein